MPRSRDDGQANGGRFARDLGYLEKFLAALRAHAATLDAGPSRRLTELLDEERVRWTEIRRLLEGEASPEPTSASAPASDPPPAEPEPEPKPEPAGRTSRRARLALTVGSLVGDGFPESSR